MQQKNHRSISLLLFWKCFLLICLPLWTLPTFFKNKKRFMHLCFNVGGGMEKWHEKSTNHCLSSIPAGPSAILIKRTAMLQAISLLNIAVGLTNYCNTLLLQHCQSIAHINNPGFSTPWRFEPNKPTRPVTFSHVINNNSHLFSLLLHQSPQHKQLITVQIGAKNPKTGPWVKIVPVYF